MEQKHFTFADISEVPDESLLPALDRKKPGFMLTTAQTEWRATGVLRLTQFLPDDLIEHYCKVRTRNPRPGGWQCPTPYMHVPEILDISLYPPLMKILEGLIGEPMMLHLNLTGWVSTERNWHCDDYLNPAHVNTWYAAVWMALDDIPADSGPFQFVPGSHRWPLVRREKLFEHYPKEIQSDDRWPTLTQGAVAQAFMDEIDRRKATVHTYLPSKGDVLIWHGRLAHRGSRPLVAGTPRKALISHYSGINHREDMQDRRQHNGQWYFHTPHTVCGTTE